MDILTTPILEEIRTFDATKDQTIYFDVIGGKAIQGHKITISSLDESWSIEFATTSMESKSVIKAGTLTNGRDYKIKLQTRDHEENYSDFSNSVLFWCYSSPEVNIVKGINFKDENRVYSQTVVFESSYYQAEGEVLESFRYILYDKNKQVINLFPEQYTLGDNNLIQEITGLENGINYYLEVRTTSPVGTLGTSGLIAFVPFYIIPKLTAAASAENLKDEGAIKLSANTVQIIMTVYDYNNEAIELEDVDFVEDANGIFLNMNHSNQAKLVVDEGFMIENYNFKIKVWLKGLSKNMSILSLNYKKGNIEVRTRNPLEEDINKNMLIATKRLKSLDNPDKYCSNIFDLNSERLYLLELQSIDHSISISIKESDI